VAVASAASIYGKGGHQTTAGRIGRIRLLGRSRSGCGRGRDHVSARRTFSRLVGDLLDDREHLFLEGYLTQMWFALVPPGCFGPEITPGELHADGLDGSWFFLSEYTGKGAGRNRRCAPAHQRTATGNGQGARSAIDSPLER